MNTNIEIELKADIDDIRGIYFRDNSQKYFFGTETKRQSLYFVLAIVIFPFFAVDALTSRGSWYFVFGCIFFSLIVYDYWKIAMPILKWKKSIHKFLEKLEQMKIARFTYNDDFFIHLQDNEELKQDWSVIERAVITDRYLWLFSNKQILLPRSSMRKDEFEALSNTIMNKVKNVEKQ